MINLPTKILLAIKPMRTQFKFTLRLICTPEYKYTPEYIYTRVFFAHANWTLYLSHLQCINHFNGIYALKVGKSKKKFDKLVKWDATQR